MSAHAAYGADACMANSCAGGRGRHGRNAASGSLYTRDRMRVAFLNPMFAVDFTKSARWFARSRGRVQRHPDYLCTAAAVVEAAANDGASLALPGTA